MSWAGNMRWWGKAHEPSGLVAVAGMARGVCRAGNMQVGKGGMDRTCFTICLAGCNGGKFTSRLDNFPGLKEGGGAAVLLFPLLSVE